MYPLTLVEPAMLDIKFPDYLGLDASWSDDD